MNYEKLPALQTKYASRGFSVVGFPCNQFKAQEPGTAEEIAKFTKERGVNFPLMAKVEVNGDGACELYKWLKATTPGDTQGTEIEWNFGKFLINRAGMPVKRYHPKADFADIDAAIDELLGGDEEKK